MHFLGSDDFPLPARRAAAEALNAAFVSGWEGFASLERFPFAQIAKAHEWVEDSRNRGRAVVEL